MDILTAIQSRRSVRKFTEQKVARPILEDLVRLGSLAPSAMNQQAWHFVIIDDLTLLKQIPEFSPYASFVKNAPAAILVCMDLKLEKISGFLEQDAAAAVENMLLAAPTFGLGATWTASYPLMDRVEGFRKLLNIQDEKIIPFALIVLGYPHPDFLPRPREMREDILSYNTF